MAKKRMFNLGVLETDAFMDLPLSAQALYFHLNLRADDDGFIGNPKRITQNIGASDNDLQELINKKFILAFDNGVVAIKHWRMHNAIKKDRYTQTNFIDELNMLHLKENGSYSLNGTPNIQILNSDNGTQMENEWNTNGEQMEQMSSTGIDIGLGKDIDIEKYKVAGIPLIDGSEWFMPNTLLDEYIKAYPLLNIKQEINKMRIWSLSNPTKRKTRRGITRFINSWLSNAKKGISVNEDVCGADNLVV